MHRMKIVEIIHRLKWDEQYNFEKVKIWYISRGEPNGMNVIEGADIRIIGKIFLVTKKGYIPHHRILRIDYDKKTVFER